MMSDTHKSENGRSSHTDGRMNGHYQTYELIDLTQTEQQVTQVVLMTAEEAMEHNQRLIDAGVDQQWRTIRAPRISTR
jgi:hypothetical protein